MIRKILLLIVIFYADNLIGQTITLKDSILKSVIINASVTSKNIGETSNVNGKVNLSKFNDTDSVVISHISYQSKKILKKNIKKIIYLKQKTIFLPEITFKTELKVLISDKYEAQKIIPSPFSDMQSSISNLLSTESSLVVQESQPGGGSPNYRGMEANRLLLIIDGITLNNTIFRSGHLQNSATINPFFIETINILSGPASVGYGNGAMGGALIFNTHKPNNKNTIKFQQQFESSSNASITNFLINYTRKNHSHLTGFSLKSFGDLKMGSNRLHGYKNWGKETVATINNKQLYTSYSQIDVIHKSKFNLNRFNSIVLNSQYSKSSDIYRFDKMNDLNNGLPKYKKWYYGPRIRFMQSINNVIKYPTLLFDSLNTTLSYQNAIESRHVQKYTDTLINNRIENVKVYDINIDFKKKFNSIRLAYGIGYKKQYVASDANLSNYNQTLYNTTRYPSGGSNVEEFFTYSQLNINISEKIDILFGGRLNESSINADFNNNSFIINNIKNNNQSFIKSILLSYKPKKNTTINASFYSGFRNPNIDDMGKIFSKDGINVVVPNKDLEPEFANNYELEFSYTPYPIKLQLQLFSTFIENAINRDFSQINGLDSIIYDGDLMRVQMNQNIEGARIDGASIFASAYINKNLELISNFNYLSGETNQDNPLAHIPPINAKFEITYKKKNSNFRFYTIYNARKSKKKYDLLGVDNLDEATVDGNAAWFTLNIECFQNISENFVVKIGIHNIMDAHYKTFGSGLSASGRNVVLSIQNNF